MKMEGPAANGYPGALREFDLSFCYWSEFAEAIGGRYSLQIREDTNAEIDNKESCVGTQIGY